MRIQKITPFNIEYNEWNGFGLTILGIEYQGNKKGFDGELFGIHFCKDHLIIGIAFIQIVINSPIY